ncbi:MAG: uncharacterized protein A8A55_2568 [Amphiamblys sp. WSBS2006]|nr:MAG: uncharacterized protein A8A55_2568 [Amphiamblys sp. WSBS2006]
MKRRYSRILGKRHTASNEPKAKHKSPFESDDFSFEKAAKKKQVSPAGSPEAHGDGTGQSEETHTLDLSPSSTRTSRLRLKKKLFLAEIPESPPSISNTHRTKDDVNRDILCETLHRAANKKDADSTMQKTLAATLSFLKRNTIAALIEKGARIKEKKDTQTEYLQKIVEEYRNSFEILSKEEERWVQMRAWKAKYFSVSEYEAPFTDDECSMQLKMAVYRQERMMRRDDLVAWTEALRFETDATHFSFATVVALRDEAALYGERLFSRLVHVFRRKYSIASQKTKTPLQLLRKTDDEVLSAMKILSQKNAIPMTPRKASR